MIQIDITPLIVHAKEILMLSKTELLDKILDDFRASMADIQACAVVSEDGLIIASSLPPNVEEARVAAMSATLLSMGGRTAIELERGEIKQIFIKGNAGYAIISNAGPHAALLVLASNSAKLGLLFYELARTGTETAEVLI